MIIKLLCMLYVNCWDGTTTGIVAKRLVCLENVTHSYELIENKGDLPCIVIVLLWIEGFDDIRELFSDQDLLIRKAARDESVILLINAFDLIMNTVKISMWSMKNPRLVQQYKKCLKTQIH